MINRFCANEIEKILDCKILENKVIFFEKIDSTNLEAKRKAKQGLIVIADKQDAGRGSHGRVWKSEGHVGIYMTFALTNDITTGLVFSVPILVSLCVAKTIERTLDVPVKIKWPNDILLNGRKLCGILAEADFANGKLKSLVVGIGINVNQENFLEEIEGKATSLRRETGTMIDRNVLAAEVLNEIDRTLVSFFEKKSISNLINDYNAHLVHYDCNIDIVKGEQRQTVHSKGIDEKGRLIAIDNKGKVINIAYGEVSVRGNGIYGE